jgi:hypothetical protein
VRRAAFTIAALLLCGSSALAGTVPAGSVVRVGGAIDLAAFTRTIATRYHVELQRVAAADIDRDGDLDVVAATDRGFLVWVNDGSGRLTSQSPREKSGLDGHAPADTWSGGQSPRGDTIQNDAPSPRLANAYAHGPPASPSQVLLSPLSGYRSVFALSAQIPRAPPSVVS